VDACELSSIAIDLIGSLTLLAIGLSPGVAQVAGAGTGSLTLLALRGAFGGRDAGRTTTAAARRPGWGVTVAFFALVLRGGVMATALQLGAPASLATATAVAAGWAVIVAGRIWRDSPGMQRLSAGGARGAQLAPAVLVTAMVLRALYLDVLPLLPEEAYYWNYALHPDTGYLDHPPLVAWLIALGEGVLGHTAAGVRFGSLVAGVISVCYVYRLARRLVDPDSALVAAAMVVALPYFFFGTGVAMTPDAPLIAAWAAALYYLHGALVAGERRAWYAAGLAIGVGLLSKYTIVLLGCAALAFMLFDKPSRRWFARREPYIAVTIALAMFLPVIRWNYEHAWASFLFQARDRFDGESGFSLHVLLGNMIVVATPFPLLVLPLLFTNRWTGALRANPGPAHAAPRNRLFAAFFVLTPLLVYGWSALEHPPRLNWTAPVWLATLPMLGWALVHAPAPRVLRCVGAVRCWSVRLATGLLALDALLLFYFVLGLPGLPYPSSFSRALGWAGAAQELQGVHDRLARTTGMAPVVVGMDKYSTAAELSYYSAARRAGVTAFGAARRDPQAMKIVNKGTVLEGDGLMFEYWNDPQEFAGRPFIMVARDRTALRYEGLASHFAELDPQTHSHPLRHDGPGANRATAGRYYYRIGYGYRPGSDVGRRGKVDARLARRR
jgi:dolichol-phosphate mannosyltransferase